MRPELDQRLGWRWLLPYGEGGPVTLFGFDEEEAAVLEEARQTVLGADASSAGGTVVINADCESLEAPVWASCVATAQTVVMIGGYSRLSRWRRHLIGFQDVRDYGLVPPSQPRVVVPLARASWTRAALALHRPGRSPVRAAVALARRLTRIGLAGPFFRHRLRIATRGNQLGTMPRIVGAGLQRPDFVPDRDFALYLGTPDKNRKTVVLPLGSGIPDRVVKIGRTPSARESLSREASNLRMLGRTPLADRLPRLLEYRESEQEAALHIEYRSRCRARESRVRKAAAAFLAELSTMDTGEIALAEWLDREGRASALRMTRPLTRVLDRAALGGAVLRLHRIHGDFTPWNCAWTEVGFFVFDWEESRPRQLAFSDAFSYVIAPALLIRHGTEPGRVVADALGFARRIAGLMALPEENLVLHLAAWLLARSARRNEPMLDALMAATVERIE